MSKIGDNSIMKASELHSQIDDAIENHAKSIIELQLVAAQAVLHAVAHGDTVFGKRIFNGLKVKKVSASFRSWFEDHAGCKWEGTDFKMIKGAPQESDIGKLQATSFHNYDVQADSKPYDFAKALSNLAKAPESKKKSPFINSGDSIQQDAVFQLIASLKAAGFVTSSLDAYVKIAELDKVGGDEKAVSF